MPNPYFQFKQFTIYQDTCTFKVGTDGVLLGAWADCESAKNILDIGTGTGLIALMMAQRCNAKITAIEIDESSYLQSKDNIERSKWSNRIEVLHTSFQHYYIHSRKKFDLIITNPPYFANAQKSPDHNRNISRHSDELPLEDLIVGVHQLLDKEGKFSIILPLNEGNRMQTMCTRYQLYKIRECLVKPTPEKDIKRIMMAFSKSRNPLQSETLAIETKKRHSYTSEYMELTRDFYLNM